MPPGAVLDHLQLSSPQPEALARYYAQAFGMTARQQDQTWICAGPGRALALVPGPANQLDYAALRLADQAAWTALRERIPAQVREAAPSAALLDGQAFAVRDPDGNRIVFILGASLGSSPTSAPVEGPAAATPAAYLQHFALRTTSPQRLMEFYTGVLGFALSDEVRDADGVLRACFVRSSHLHHVLAIFMSPEARYDHQSFEAHDWMALRDWADHMGAQKLPLVWGIGRHGPGNDAFFMIADPDGNLAEISTEIEVCAPERPAGLWPHEQRTLNLWGSAIMRS